jgi:hypothetical protein
MRGVVERVGGSFSPSLTQPALNLSFSHTRSLPLFLTLLAGRPVLVGTTSVEKSELVASMLQQDGIKFQV